MNKNQSRMVELLAADNKREVYEGTFDNKTGNGMFFVAHCDRDAEPYECLFTNDIEQLVAEGVLVLFATELRDVYVLTAEARRSAEKLCAAGASEVYNPDLRMTCEEAEALGFMVDKHCYPWFGYKGPRFAPTESVACWTSLEAVAIEADANDEHANVCTFWQKFDLPVESEPAFLDQEAFLFQLKIMQEELNEFLLGHQSGNMHDAADALVDLAYVAHGTAIRMGLPWSELWKEVHRANMRKVRAERPEQSKRGTAVDVVKPEGWAPPDHAKALGEGPWPVVRWVCPTCKSKGFEKSRIEGSCTFCDGTVGGNPPALVETGSG